MIPGDSQGPYWFGCRRVSNSGWRSVSGLHCRSATRAIDLVRSAVTDLSQLADWERGVPRVGTEVKRMLVAAYPTKSIALYRNRVCVSLVSGNGCFESACLNAPSRYISIQGETVSASKCFKGLDGVPIETRLVAHSNEDHACGCSSPDVRGGPKQRAASRRLIVRSCRARTEPTPARGGDRSP